MGRSAKLKQQRRLLRQEQEKQALAEAEKRNISRRNFIIGAGGLIACMATGISVHNLTKPTTYAQAMKDSNKRENWTIGLVDKADIPEYANIVYADEEDYANLRKKHEGSIARPEDAFAVSIPRDESLVAQGTETDIHISPGCFLDTYRTLPQVWSDLDLIIRNVVENHELLHADHFHHGINGYDLESFRNKDGTFNKGVFISVSEMLGHKGESDGLLSKQDQAMSPLFSEYLKSIPMLTTPYVKILYGSKFTKDLDEKFISKLRVDLDPRKLFS